MSDNFLNFPKELKRNILEGAESTLGIKPYLLEKDIWICWILSESLYHGKCNPIS